MTVYSESLSPLHYQTFTLAQAAYVPKNAKPQTIIRPQAFMKKIPPKILFQDISSTGNKQKIELLKLKIAAGEYCIDPHNIAEKLIASGLFFNMSRTGSLRRPWLF